MILASFGADPLGNVVFLAILGAQQQKQRLQKQSTPLPLPRRAAAVASVSMHASAVPAARGAALLCFDGRHAYSMLHYRSMVVLLQCTMQLI